MISLMTCMLSYLLINIKSQTVIPNLSGKCYLDLQDLNIGVNVHISARGEGDMYCSPELDPRLWRIQNAEVIKYAIMEINRNESVLPNISLGYIMVDGCNRDIVALARNMRNMSV